MMSNRGNASSSDFPFIVSSGPKLENDHATRTLIRKQAMRDVGIARKRKGNFGKQNAGQFPPARTDISIRPVVSIPPGARISSRSSGSSQTASPDSLSSGSSTSGNTKESEDADIDGRLERQLVSSHRSIQYANAMSYVQTTSMLSAYETTRSRFNVDITDLSMLTNFNVGRSTISILSADSDRLAVLLGEQQWSYLDYVPSQYGQSQCLTAATDCVLAKVKSVLAPQSGTEELGLRLYARALRSLQKAIMEEPESPDVLAATQMLSLHELFDASRDSAWRHHVKGSARLVRHRGTKRFKTEFEKALIAGHVGTMVSESLIANEHCYLEAPEWCACYLDMVQDSDFLTDRSPLTLKVRLLMFKVPGLWREVDHLVSSERLFDDDAVAELGVQCRALQDELLSWTEDYKSHCVKMSLTSPTPKEIAMRRELFGTSVECLMLLKRLLATVYDVDRPQLEAECQALAQLISDLQKQPSPKHSWLFTSHETGIAYTVTTTRDQWEEAAAETDIERKFATRQRYTTWSRMLRMSE